MLLEGHNWEPLQPIDIVADSTDLLISFHVPVAPLKFDLPYLLSDATDFKHKGFRVTTPDAVDLEIQAVEIVADTIVLIRLTETPPAGALVWYA